ncbi:MAG: hypothetical protein HYX59_01700 [Elusimicrobia bacterium]|nr:hypothetical protein [Elusimicrobiota bacterium]
MARPNFEILAYDDTPLGPLCLRRRELLAEPGTIVTEVSLNHEFLMSSYNTASERALTNFSLEMHGGAGLDMLVGGLGLGYTARAHDLILIDVDQSPEDRLASANGAFYTEEGLERAKSHLKPGGVLGVWSYDESSPFASALRRVYREVRVEPVEFKNRFVGGTETDWLFFARP